MIRFWLLMGTLSIFGVGLGLLSWLGWRCYNEPLREVLVPLMWGGPVAIGLSLFGGVGLTWPFRERQHVMKAMETLSGFIAPKREG